MPTAKGRFHGVSGANFVSIENARLPLLLGSATILEIPQEDTASELLLLGEGADVVRPVPSRLADRAVRPPTVERLRFPPERRQRLHFSALRTPLASGFGTVYRRHTSSFPFCDARAPTRAFAR